MICIVRRLLPALLLWIAFLTSGVATQAQDANLSASVPSRVPVRPAITVLDSTKEQDGLLGSVRRVKTETAMIELKDGRAVEGPTQLVEVTTYNIKGTRIENTSYPIAGAQAGKEEYKYDERGNITEMTVRDERGSIVNREAYSYEFDKFGNWTKMVTSLVVFENGELKREPVEVTYRTVTYYFDDTVAKIVEAPQPSNTAKPVNIRKPANAPAVPDPARLDVRDQEILEPGMPATPTGSLELAGEPPSPMKPAQPQGVESAYAARKQSEVRAEPVAATRAPVAATRVAVNPEPQPTTAHTEATNQKLAYELYIAGRDRFDAGDTAGAVESFLQSIKAEPRSAEAQMSLGHAYLKLQKDREAIKAFKEAIKLNPNVAETHYGLGYSNFRLARFRDAADAFKKATTMEPRMAKAHYGLSLAYQELGNTMGLMEEYRILERLDKTLAKKLAQTFPQFNFSCRLTRGCP